MTATGYDDYVRVDEELGIGGVNQPQAKNLSLLPTQRANSRLANIILPSKLMKTVFSLIYCICRDKSKYIVK